MIAFQNGPIKVTHNAGGTSELEMRPVYTGSEENKQFYAATPGGSFTASVPAAVAQTFTPGAEYYLDFTAAA